jgi:hypothetical protein
MLGGSLVTTAWRVLRLRMEGSRPVKFSLLTYLNETLCTVFILYEYYCLLNFWGQKNLLGLFLHSFDRL